MKFRNPFAPKTAKSIVQNIFDQIDELEKISEQQELIFDQRQAQIDELKVEQIAATTEGLYAEKVAAKLRAIVVVEEDESEF